MTKFTPEQLKRVRTALADIYGITEKRRNKILKGCGKDIILSKITCGNNPNGFLCDDCLKKFEKELEETNYEKV